MRKQTVGECLRVYGTVLCLPTWHDIPLGMGQRLGVVSRLLDSEIPKDGPKLSLSEGRQQQLDEFPSSCKAVVFSWIKRKNVNFALKIQYPCSDSGCLHAVSTKFPDRTLLTGSILLRKCDGTDVWMLICLSLWMGSGASPWSHHQGKVLLKSDLHASIFKPCVSLCTQNIWKVMFLQEKKCINRECFQPSIYRELSTF